jgi:hypothetical protein
VNNFLNTSIRSSSPRDGAKPNDSSTSQLTKDYEHDCIIGTTGNARLRLHRKLNRQLAFRREKKKQRFITKTFWRHKRGYYILDSKYSELNNIGIFKEKKFTKKTVMKKMKTHIPSFTRCTCHGTGAMNSLNNDIASITTRHE